MAMYCAKCGTAIQGGSKFCQSCGAPAPPPMQAAPTPPVPRPQPQQQWAAAPPPPPQSPQQQWTPPPYAAGQPVPPPQQKSGKGLKVVLIVVGVLVVLFVLAIGGVAFFAWRASRVIRDNVSIKEGPGGKSEVSINTPGGQLKLNTKPDVTEEKLGVPIYPGAKVEDSGGTFSITGEGDKGGSFGGASFTTTDSLDKVVDFYKSRLGSKASVYDSTAQGKHTVVMNVSTQDSWKTITIEDEGTGVTKIGVASISGKTSQ